MLSARCGAVRSQRLPVTDPIIPHSLPTPCSPPSPHAPRTNRFWICCDGGPGRRRPRGVQAQRQRLERAQPAGGGGAQRPWLIGANAWWRRAPVGAGAGERLKTAAPRAPLHPSHSICTVLSRDESVCAIYNHLAAFEQTHVTTLYRRQNEAERLARMGFAHLWR